MIRIGTAIRGQRLRSHLWLPPACIVIAVAFAYSTSLNAPFLFDDAGAVLNNPTIRSLGSFAVLNPPDDGSTTTGRPMVNLSFAFNYAFGRENVRGYHAVNVAIHALAALVLLGVVRRTLVSPALRGKFGAAAPTLGFLTAIVWALHPLQTESVTCIAQRTESLCGLFYLLTLYGFIRATGLPEQGGRPRQRAWFVVSVGSCVLGMATKEVMASAPLVVFIYDRTFVAGTFVAAWRQRRGYYLALAGTWLLLGWLVVGGGGARGASAGFGLGVTWWTYLLTQCEALIMYLVLTVWPHPLVLDYGTGVTSSLAAVWWQALLVVGLLAVVGWAMVRKPAVGFAGAVFFLILAPSSSFVPLVTQTMAEHRMYLPLAAVVALVAAFAHTRLGRRAGWILGMLAMVFAVLTFERNRVFRDGVTIWSDTVVKRPGNARAHNNLAFALQQQGGTERAHEHFARAIALSPDYVTARYNWGVALLEQGRLPQAIAQFEVAVRLAPDHIDARINLGNALVRAERARDAIPHYAEALRMQPGPDVYYNLGVAQADLGESEPAIASFRAALQRDARQPEAHFQLARLAERAGRSAEAESHYEETLRLAPSHAGAHARLGLLLARAERLAPAAEHFRAVIRLQPNDASAHANLGNILLLQGRGPEAMARYEEAIRLNPGDARLRESLASIRASLR